MKEIIIKGDFEIEGLPHIAKHLKYCKIKAILIPDTELMIEEFSTEEEMTK